MHSMNITGFPVLTTIDDVQTKSFISIAFLPGLGLRPEFLAHRPSALSNPLLKRWVIQKNLKWLLGDRRRPDKLHRNVEIATPFR
jgi:hypothetical protein